MFKREAGLVVKLNVLQLVCIYMWKSQKSVYICQLHIAVQLDAIFDETGSIVFVIAGEKFLFSLKIAAEQRYIKQGRRNLNYFSLPLFSFFNSRWTRWNEEELRRKHMLRSLLSRKVNL